MKKTTASALVLAMAITCFCAISASAEDPVNLVAGSHDYSYYVVDAEGNEVENTEDDSGYFWNKCRDDDHTLLTDGKVRKPFQLTAGGDPVRTITLELAGTTKTFYIDFSLGDTCTVSSVVLDGVRRGYNRFCHILKIEAKVGGAWQNVAFNETERVIPDSEQYALEGGEGKDQFFTVEEVFAAPVANATNIRIALDTDPGGEAAEKYALSHGGGREYIVQLDEVAVMGTKGGTAAPVVSEEPAPSEEPAVVPATYTVTLTDNGDGTATITATLPAGVATGKIVITPSANLTYIADSLKGEVPSTGTVENYDMDGITGQCVVFVSFAVIPEGVVVFTANYTVKEGAELGKGDIICNFWNLGDVNSKCIGTAKDGDVVKVYVPAPRYLPGDVNFDGCVDNIDASLILQYDAGLIGEADLPRFDLADVNSDGEADNVDASLILQYDAGLISSPDSGQETDGGYKTSPAGTNYARNATYTFMKNGEYEPARVYLCYDKGIYDYADIDPDNPEHQFYKMNDGVVGDIAAYTGTGGAYEDTTRYALPGTTVQYFGTDAAFEFRFDLGDHYGDIKSLVFRNVRHGTPNGNNRGFEVKLVQASDDGADWHRVKGELTSVQIAGAPEIESMMEEGAKNVEYFDFTYTFDEPVQAKNLKIILSNDDGFILQLEEIEIRN